MKRKFQICATVFCLTASTLALTSCTNSEDELSYQHSGKMNTEIEQEQPIEVDSGKISEFWNWFQQNEDRLGKMKGPYDPLFNELTSKLQEIDPRLKIEIGVPSSRRYKFQLEISPELNPALFSAARKIVAAVPETKYFEVVAFKQRLHEQILRKLELSNSDAEHNYYSLSIRDLRYRMNIVGHRANIVILIRNYKADEPNSIHMQDMSLMMLHQALGEYDLVTKVGNITFDTLDKSTEKDSSAFVFIARELDSKLPQQAEP